MSARPRASRTAVAMLCAVGVVMSRSGANGAYGGNGIKQRNGATEERTEFGCCRARRARQGGRGPRTRGGSTRAVACCPLVLPPRVHGPCRAGFAGRLSRRPLLCSSLLLRFSV